MNFTYKMIYLKLATACVRQTEIGHLRKRNLIMSTGN